MIQRADSSENGCRYSYSDIRKLDGKLVTVLYGEQRKTGYLTAPRYGTRRITLTYIDSDSVFRFYLNSKLIEIYLLILVQQGSD